MSNKIKNRIESTFSKSKSLCILFLISFISEGITFDQNFNEYLQKTDSLLFTGDYERAKNEYEKTLQTLKARENLKLRASINNKIGRCLSLAGKDKEAAPYFKKSIRQARLVNDSITLSDALNNCGITHEYTGNPDSAFLCFEKSLLIREKFNDTTRIAASLRNMAQILRVLRRTIEAKKYCRKAFSMIPGIRDFKIVANIYNETAYLFELNDQLDSAKIYYNKLINISTKNNYVQGISVGLTNLASVLEHEKKFAEALILKKRGLAIDKDNNDIYGTMTSYISIAGSYLLLNDYANALIIIDSADAICDPTWISDRQGIENTKYEAYKGLGNSKLALLHFEKSVELNDSLFNEQKRKNIAEILTKYETEKKEQQIELLNKTNQLKTERIRIHWIILIAIFLLSAGGASVSLLVIKNKNHRINQMSLELHNYLLQFKDLNEHRLAEKSQYKNPVQTLTENFGLTKRETEIMELISSGLKNNEIAEKLFVSENTIKFHIKNIYIKLDVKNRVQAMQKSTI